ncbi:hypothetical protein RN001_000688 [Aquatica leii]|uniref:Uncharacterized protein n=1 Tax=Aquatica leii TaxID=1421715 RepID=A0AAN7SJ94_9COLE|nr:hypothetical protein RN001_000688 [Aquatica leii]
MHRVLSGQTARCIETSQEYVSKRLCISFVFVFAFFSMLGGFFLGRYALNYSDIKKSMEEKNPYAEVTNRLAISANKIKTLSLELSHSRQTKTSAFNYTALYSQFECQRNCKLVVDNYKFKHNLSVDVYETILEEFHSLDDCYNNITHYLETELTSIKDIK